MEQQAAETVAEEHMAGYWDIGDASPVIQTRVVAEGIAVAEAGSLVVVAAEGRGLVVEYTAAERGRHSEEHHTAWAVVDSLKSQQKRLGSVQEEGSVLRILHHWA